MAIIQNLKNSVYLAIKIRNILVVNSSVSGAPPLDPDGNFRLPDPLWFAPLGQITSYATDSRSIRSQKM